MAKYSRAQLQQNRRSIATSTMGVIAALLLLTALDVINLRAGLGLIVFAGFTAAIMWYLFASKNAGNIDGTWVDGWNAETDPNPHWWHILSNGAVRKSPRTRHAPPSDSHNELPQ